MSSEKFDEPRKLSAVQNVEGLASDDDAAVLGRLTFGSDYKNTDFA